MTKQEEQKIVLDILKAELRCKSVDCDKNVIFCSQCSNVKYSDEEIADALRYAIECIEKCEHLVGDTLEIVGEYVDDCICVYDFEIFGRNVPMIPVETVHQLLERIGEEAKGSDYG